MTAISEMVLLKMEPPSTGRHAPTLHTSNAAASAGQGALHTLPQLRYAWHKLGRYLLAPLTAQQQLLSLGFQRRPLSEQGWMCKGRALG